MSTRLEFTAEIFAGAGVKRNRIVTLRVVDASVEGADFELVRAVGMGRNRCEEQRKSEGEDGEGFHLIILWPRAVRRKSGLDLSRVKRGYWVGPKALPRKLFR